MAIKKAWDLVDEAKKEIENLSIEQLKEEMEADAEVLVVDIREIQERIDLGCVPGSVHAARGMLEFWADPESEYYRDWFQPERRTILYCAGGGRSALAAKALQDMGFTNVAHVEAGFSGWSAAGEVVEDAAASARWMRKPK
jgi:rhodanese-related sulfurtransferase